MQIRAGQCQVIGVGIFSVISQQYHLRVRKRHAHLNYHYIDNKNYQYIFFLLKHYWYAFSVVDRMIKLAASMYS